MSGETPTPRTDELTDRLYAEQPMPTSWHFKAIADFARTLERELAEAKKGWIPVTERLPESGCPVWVGMRNRLGKWRTLRGHYSAKHSVDASHWENQELIDADDKGIWEPEGWWEEPVMGEELFFIGEGDGTVTHWMPLPEPPK